MSNTSQLLKTAALALLEQNNRITKMAEEMQETKKQLSALENEKTESNAGSSKKELVDQIVAELSKKKAMTDEEKERKTVEFMANKTDAELKSYLQALKESSVYSEELGKVASSTIEEIDEWDSALIKSRY